MTDHLDVQSLDMGPEFVGGELFVRYGLEVDAPVLESFGPTYMGNLLFL